MKSLYQALTPRITNRKKYSIKNVLDLTDLDQKDLEAFLKFNYITQSIEQLYRAVMGRLNGTFDLRLG